MRIFACMASSLDGKIGPANVDQFVSITSRYDMEHLKSLRDDADGILFGAETFRTWPKVHQGHDQTKKQHHFMMSRRLNFDVNTPLFQAFNTPLTIFTPTKSSDHNFPDQVEVVNTPAGAKQLPFIVKYIGALGCKSLLIEGGGRILHQFIETQLLQELYLTIAPKIIGDSKAPGLLGNQIILNSPEIKVFSSRQVDDEVYLHLGLSYS